MLASLYSMTSIHASTTSQHLPRGPMAERWRQGPGMLVSDYFYER